MASANINRVHSNSRISSRASKSSRNDSNMFTILQQPQFPEVQRQKFKSTTKSRIFGTTDEAELITEKSSKSYFPFLSDDAKTEALENKRKFTQRRNPITGEVLTEYKFNYGASYARINDEDKDEIDIIEEPNLNINQVEKLNLDVEKEQENTEEESDIDEKMEKLSIYSIENEKEQSGDEENII